jgi:hypothetical protein
MGALQRANVCERTSLVPPALVGSPPPSRPSRPLEAPRKLGAARVVLACPGGRGWISTGTGGRGTGSAPHRARGSPRTLALRRQKGLFFRSAQWGLVARFVLRFGRLFCFRWQGLESAVTEEGHIQVATRRYPHQCGTLFSHPHPRGSAPRGFLPNKAMQKVRWGFGWAL